MSIAGIPKDLIVPLDGLDQESMLEFWRWLIPADARPLFATALGDLFLSDVAEEVLWLDVGVGALQTVAQDTAEFERLASNIDNRSTWFGRRLVDDLRAAGKVLGAGQCYSYVQSPILGSEYEPHNFRIYDVVTHFRVWGPIHEQLHNLPDGTRVTVRLRTPEDSEDGSS